MSYTYLLINTFIILPPFLMSFDKKVAYFRNWRSIFPAIGITGTIFIIWDSWFTSIGVWSFNPDYLIGVYFLELPLEEWLFFLTVPYSCMFILEVLRAYFRISFTARMINKSYGLIIGVTALLGLIFWENRYTFVSFLFTATTLLIIHIYYRSQTKGWFLLAYLLGLLPFFIVNGVLTALPVVMYNDEENLAIRIFTIPIEDAIYGMGLLMMNFGLYEFFKGMKTTDSIKSY